jgi:hypothetical protein
VTANTRCTPPPLEGVLATILKPHAGANGRYPRPVRVRCGARVGMRDRKVASYAACEIVQATAKTWLRLVVRSLRLRLVYGTAANQTPPTLSPFVSPAAWSLA